MDVLIGLEESHRIVAGCEYFPATGEMFTAGQGRGRVLGRPYDSGVEDHEEERSAALLQRDRLHAPAIRSRRSFCDWISEFWTVRSTGGCLDAMLVASGRADVWIEAQAKPWDLAPLKIIAEEAGCVTFDFDGNDTIYGGNYVITVPALADEIKRFVMRRAA